MKLKHRERADTQRAAEVLRELASALEAGRFEFGDRSLTLPGAEAELTLKVEMEEDELELKVELSWDLPERNVTGEGSSSRGVPGERKALKKEMEALFKEISREIVSGRFPEEAALSRFLELHHLYAPYAADFRSAWEQATRLAEDLLRAVKEGQQDEARRLFEEIARAKKVCHKLYKK